ncbi:MAG: DUF695 domain-containing protein [Planctomycetes bacterium]|nr:DUF695 domain-containing protein [Planctomycetota bacterium]
MQENWDSYFLTVEDRPASMFVDLGARKAAPRPELPVMAYVRLHLNAPLASGLSSGGEFDTLVAIEDALETGLVGPECAYVGRCTTNGCRDFVFYVARAEGWEERVGAVLAAYPAYRFDVSARPDSTWSVYADFLFPSDESLQSIHNRRLCDRIEEHGDALTEPREVDHWAYFDADAGIDAFVIEAAELGFALRERIEPTADSRRGVRLWRSDLPSHAAIDSIVLPLFRLARTHGGHYDGWETFIVRSPEPNAAPG